MKLKDSLSHSQGQSNNPYSELNQPNSSYFFKIHSNIVFPSKHLTLLFIFTLFCLSRLDLEYFPLNTLPGKFALENSLKKCLFPLAIFFAFLLFEFYFGGKKEDIFDEGKKKVYVVVGGGRAKKKLC